MMQFFLLQQAIQNVQANLFQYGILGLFCFLMLWVIWYLEKQRKGREDKQEQRLEKLEAKFDEYQKIDRIRMEDLIQKNIEVMDDVKQLLETERG